MSLIISIVLIPALFLLLTRLLRSIAHMLQKPPQKHRRLPPGPLPLPVIGNLHSMGTLPHRALQALARTYGPVMSVHLGQVRTVVISSPEAAEQVMKSRDTAFASRPRIQASEYLCYGNKGIGFTEYGPYWRFVRKLCTVQLLSASRIESFAPLRRQEVGSMVARLRTAADANEAVDLSQSVSEIIADISFNMIVGSGGIETVDFKALAKEGFRLIGTFNLADYVPFLGPLDLQGLTRKMGKLSKDMDKILDEVIKKIQKRCEEKKRKSLENETPASFIEVLLTLMNQSTIDNSNENQDQEYTIQLANVKALLVDMIAASFDTSVTAIEWALSVLLKHPNVMARVQRELNDVVGMERMVEEADLLKLPYLEMVIMESFRLYPVSPLLVPRESIENAEVNGYFIPKKTRVLINNYAIGRDPNVWSDNAEEFIPERFLGHTEMSYKGSDFRFIPFGSGRRGCPGMQLGLTSVRLVVAQLVHCFNWKLPNRMLPRDLDMAEKFGLTMTRDSHLLALPTYRLK